MNRVQKKCLIASTGLHGLLLAVVLFGSAFFTSKDKLDKTPTVEFIPLDPKLTDGLTAGGGNPKAKPAASVTTPTAAPTKPDVVPPAAAVPKPEPVKPVKPEPVPPKPKPEAVVKPPPIKDNGFEPTPKQTKKKKEIEVDPKKLVVRNNDDAKARDDAAKKKAQQDKEAREYADAQRKAQAANAARFKGALNNLKNNLSTGTDIEQIGLGDGPASADYAQFVKKVYDEAWIAPGDGADDSATVQVEVTIARSGNVVSAKIKKRSGSVVLDNSIDRVLKRVSFVAPFPEGAKDAQRTFVINFNLKAKRLSG